MVDARTCHLEDAGVAALTGRDKADTVDLPTLGARRIWASGEFMTLIVTIENPDSRADSDGQFSRRNSGLGHCNRVRRNRIERRSRRQRTWGRCRLAAASRADSHNGSRGEVINPNASSHCTSEEHVKQRAQYASPHNNSGPAFQPTPERCCVRLSCAGHRPDRTMTSRNNSPPPP
jgi:hypothetical protein